MFKTTSAIDRLAKEFANYTNEQSLEEGDCLELLMSDTLDRQQRAWLSDFYNRWEKAASDDRHFYDKQTVVEA